METSPWGVDRACVESWCCFLPVFSPVTVVNRPQALLICTKKPHKHRLPCRDGEMKWITTTNSFDFKKRNKHSEKSKPGPARKKEARLWDTALFFNDLSVFFFFSLCARLSPTVYMHLDSCGFKLHSFASFDRRDVARWSEIQGKTVLQKQKHAFVFWHWEGLEIRWCCVSFRHAQTVKWRAVRLAINYSLHDSSYARLPWLIGFLIFCGIKKTNKP